MMRTPASSDGRNRRWGGRWGVEGSGNNQRPVSINDGHLRLDSAQKIGHLSAEQV